MIVGFGLVVSFDDRADNGEQTEEISKESRGSFPKPGRDEGGGAEGAYTDIIAQVPVHHSDVPAFPAENRLVLFEAGRSYAYLGDFKFTEQLLQAFVCLRNGKDGPLNGDVPVGVDDGREAGPGAFWTGCCHKFSFFLLRGYRKR